MDSFLDRPALRLLLDSGDALDCRGRRLGRFTLREEIGRGGMGIVFEALDEEVERLVAVKLLLGVHASERRAVQRFETEARTLVHLDHPAFVKIHGAGHTDEGVPYYAMELVHGKRIDTAVLDLSLSSRAILGLFVELCDAIAHAHRHGVVHRDLKPSNVMVGMNDDVPYVRVLDLGLAHVSTQARHDSPSSGPIGTLGYISPEQLRGEGRSDSRSDIYSLGVVLADLMVIAGEDGFDQRRATRPKGALRLIADKAMSIDPDDRYQTVDDLVHDVRSHLDGFPVSVHPASIAYAARCAVARRPMTTLFVALSASSVALLGALLLWSWDSAAKAALLERDAAVSVLRFQQRMAKQEASAMVRDGKDSDSVRLMDVLNRSVRELDEGALNEKRDVGGVLRVVVGNRYLALGEHEAAREQLELAIPMLDDGAFQSSWGFLARERLSRTLDVSGRWDEALLVRTGLLEAQRRELGELDDETISSLRAVGGLLHRVGRTAEAITVYERLLESARERYGPGHVATWRAHRALQSLRMSGERDGPEGRAETVRAR